MSASKKADTAPRAGLDRVTSCGGCLVRAAWAVFTGIVLIVYVAKGGLGLPSLWLILAAVVAAVMVVLRGPLTTLAVAAGATSLVVTALVAAGSPTVGVVAVVEALALLMLIMRVVRRVEHGRVVTLTVVLGGAVVALPLRESTIEAVLFSPLLAVLVAAAVGVGAYFRALDNRRARALLDARQAERLELARDLHDFVAHHVTGIVVQAQAVRYAAQAGAAQSPEQLDALMAGIENAGTKALSSMRRLVGVLRETEEATTRPAGDLERVQELVAEFTRTGPPATLLVSPEVARLELPPEVATSIHRVAQEALTNARKHAPDATGIQVTVHRAHEGIEVAVRDNGQGGGRRMPYAARGGGFGIVGLTERVEAIGGHLSAGPRPEGGWELVAVLPLAESHP